MPPKILDSLLNFFSIWRPPPPWTYPRPAGYNDLLATIHPKLQVLTTKGFSFMSSSQAANSEVWSASRRIPVKNSSQTNLSLQSPWLSRKSFTFSMTCEEYFCLSQEGRWDSATPNAVIKGHLSVSSWWFSVAQEICHVFLPWKTIPRTQKSGTIHCIKNPSAENSLHFPNTQNFSVKQIREINMQNKT